MIDKKRLTNIIANVSWVRGFLEGEEDKFRDCCEKLDDALSELEKEAGA